MCHRPLLRTALLAVACSLLVAPAALGQSVEVEPASPTIEVGESRKLEGFYVGPDGERRRDTTIVFFSRSDGAPTTRAGTVTAEAPGTHEVIALRPATGDQERLFTRVQVTVPKPAVATVAFEQPPEQVYAGTQVTVPAVAKAKGGRTRDDVRVTIESSDPNVATVDVHHRVRGVAPGTVTLTATAQGQQATTTVEVVENPAAALELSGGADSARTGDVLDFAATARTEGGEAVDDAPIRYAVRTEDTEAIVPRAAAEIGADEVVEVDLEDWSVARRLDTGEGTKPYNLEVSPDGKTLVVSYKGSGETGFWNLETGERAARRSNSRTVSHGVVISPDSRYAFVTAEGVGGEPGGWTSST